MALLAMPENRTEVEGLIDSLIEHTGPERRMPVLAATAVLQHILGEERPAVRSIPHKRRTIAAWLSAAAVAVFFLSGAAYWGFYRQPAKTLKAAAARTNALRIQPGGDRATLIMADGRTIDLDSMTNTTFRQKGVNINNRPGSLVYDPAFPSGAGTPVAYNTLNTPRGGQYRLVLSDGTKVWLNAASSLYFPTAFTGADREVRLTGEAYFEVAKNIEKPFRVIAGGMEVKVLGTRFNVNAYADEAAVRTSLLDGSVRILEGSRSGILKPGQQAILDKGKSSMEIANADMDEVMAWKNGLFQFDGADISTIMRQIGRWYDVEVRFAGKASATRFEGKISRKAELKDVLQILELSNVRFSLEGKTIVVR
jgi:ferric-dicitrate binding protein FerR (iron transport regulator)